MTGKKDVSMKGDSESPEREPRKHHFFISVEDLRNARTLHELVEKEGEVFLGLQGKIPLKICIASLS